MISINYEFCDIRSRIQNEYIRLEMAGKKAMDLFNNNRISKNLCKYSIGLNLIDSLIFEYEEFVNYGDLENAENPLNEAEYSLIGIKNIYLNIPHYKPFFELAKERIDFAKNKLREKRAA